MSICTSSDAYDSINDFKNNLKEVDILMSYSRVNKKSLDKYKLFNKMAIVLLCCHFESFIEAFISEHVDMLKACYNSGNIPQYMKDNYVNDAFETLKNRSKPSSDKKTLNALFKLHDSAIVDMSNLNDLKLDMKYSFGKHGQEETEKIFNKFGLNSFVASVEFKTSFKVINSAISIRNNIIHEGSAPTLSYEDLSRYVSNFLKFADGLYNHIMKNQKQYYGKIIYK